MSQKLIMWLKTEAEHDSENVGKVAVKIAFIKLKINILCIWNTNLYQVCIVKFWMRWEHKQNFIK